MKCYAVIDTNVLVSALLSTHETAATVQIVDKLTSGGFCPLFSDDIMAEYNEVLRRKKFDFPEMLVRALLNSVEKYGSHVIPPPSGKVLPDLKDVPFYEVVMEKRDDDAYLVTGNIKHFPEEPFIVTPREFLEILEQEA